MDDAYLGPNAKPQRHHRKKEEEQPLPKGTVPARRFVRRSLYRKELEQVRPSEPNRKPE